MAASTSRPLPIVEISWPSTVTEADFTRWMTAEENQYYDGKIEGRELWSVLLMVLV
jgi:hypothetical protein